jgi:hypothetical protein
LDYILRGDIAVFRRFICVILFAALLLVACQGEAPPELAEPSSAPVPSDTSTPAPQELSEVETTTEEEQAQEHQDEPLIFTTTMRIHEDMPEFTFYRIVGDFVPDLCNEIPSPREVSIVIEDEEGNVIQTISDFTQSDSWGEIESNGITFDDYNFDGYMDMRLLRHNLGHGTLRSYQYFWLWDTETSQFVLDKQLVEVEASEININPNTRQIEAWYRDFDGQGSSYSYYKHLNREFVLVMHERHIGWRDSKTDLSYRSITRTDVRTGEITTEIITD